jgi:ABC-type multidrug transport system fused ATPase/permease subunit
MLLREIIPSRGTVGLEGSISYASQEPWILSQSIKDNILFGEDFDEDWYLQVLEACSLNSDISRLPAGDETEIGERGVTLSGGQRARFVHFDSFSLL